MTQNESNQVFAADPEEVRALLECLLEAFSRFVDDRADAGRNFRYVDTFMAAHNFHKNIVIQLVKLTGHSQLYRMAADTFSEAMERELEQQADPKLPTTERLAQALEDTGDPKLRPLIDRARQGYYDDYKSPLATPLVQLAADLQQAGHPELVQRVIGGEFDATPAESEAWANSPEGQALFNELRESPGGEALYQKLFGDGEEESDGDSA